MWHANGACIGINENLAYRNAEAVKTKEILDQHVDLVLKYLKKYIGNVLEPQALTKILLNWQNLRLHYFFQFT